MRLPTYVCLMLSFKLSFEQMGAAQWLERPSRSRVGLKDFSWYLPCLTFNIKKG